MKPFKRFEFAPRERLKSLEHLAPRLFLEVIGIAYEDCLVTDESDLLDFVRDGHSMEDFLERLSGHYFIDVEPIESTRIVDILAFLEKRGVSG